MAPSLPQLSAAMSSQDKGLLSNLKSVSVLQRIRVITNPATLMPARASRRKDLSIDFGNGRVLTGTEQHDYTFRTVGQ